MVQAYGMDESTERFHRVVRKPADDEFVITPPRGLLDEIERLGSDPRRPRSAIARWTSRLWLEATHEAIRNGDGGSVEFASHSEKELMERPQHYPTHWGLDLIPFPSDLGGTWLRDKTLTTCYTSLSTPRPFDPHIHGDLTEKAVGFGYHYLSKSPFPDQYDVVSRRGGGPRGGFAHTTGPTEGAYPTAILPQPTFNLGRLGFSDGGWNPEGLQYTNRPKRMQIGGLRNGWAHKVMFARSRRVMFRNLYGPISTDEATPRAPTVVINGSLDLHGVLSVSMTRSLNSPAQVSIELNNLAGRRSGTVRKDDTVQVFAAPRAWATPPLLFTGFVSEVRENSDRITITALDAVGFLSRETIKSSITYFQTDAATVAKDIIANSAYAPPVGRLINESFVILPAGMNFVGQTRLKAVQSILSMINSTPNLVALGTDPTGVITLTRLREVDDATVVPLTAGSIPRTTTPQDFYPTNIEREAGDADGFNVITIRNTDRNISITTPATTDSRYPSRPIERIIDDKTVQNENHARLIGEFMLSTQGATKNRFTVVGLPERFDIIPGDVIEFASTEGGLSGRQRIFDVRWMMTPEMSEMTLTVGRQAPDLIATLRLAAQVSQ